MIIDEMPIPPGIKIHCELNEIKTWIDPFHMRRVVENLLRNAIDSISRKWQNHRLRYLLKGENAVIKVSDNGRGIPRGGHAESF